MALRPAAVFLLLDWFIPGHLRADAAMHRQARIYLVTHLFGPPLGFMLSFAFYVLDPHPGPAFWLLTALEAAFYLYPFLLRATGSLAVLAPISVQHFTFVILFGSFQYGGVSSPFFPWLGIVPLAATFYLNGRPRILALLLVCVQILGFYMIHARGFAEDDSVFAEVRPLIEEALVAAVNDGNDDVYQLQQVIRRTTGRWVNSTHRRRPMIIPAVLEA